MKTDRFEGKIIALSPLHHGGDESTGSRATLRRMKFLVPDNSDSGIKKMDIPVISGNSIRGILRRLVMRDMFDILGYELKSIKTYHMLFAGGTLESVSSSDAGAINLDMRKRFRSAIPALSIFGTAVGNQMIEGKMKCSYAIPVCRELAQYLPVGVCNPESLTSYELISDDFTTRRDDLHAEREDGEAAHQMIVNFEVMAPGTQLYHKFTLLDCNEIETATLGRALELWQKRPYVGGKSSIGLGEVKLDYPAIDSTAYLNYLKDKKDVVVAALTELEEMLK